MTRQRERTNRSQQKNGNVMIIFPDFNARQSNQSKPTVVRHVDGNLKAHPRYHEEFFVVDKEKAAQTGRWVLNVIARREADQKQEKIKRKKQSFQSRLSSKVEPIEKSSSQFYHTHINNQNINRLPHEVILSPMTIDDDHTTHLSSFSSATSVDDVRTIDRSSISTQTRSNDCSTDEFKNGEEQQCISKRAMIIFTIVSVILVIGIIVAVFVTIFVGKNDSTNSTTNNTDPKSIFISQLSIDGLICSTPMFNITDPLCEGQVPYNYYACYQMATSTSLTIQFSLQHDTMSGHWYFDDISAVQNDTIQLIINGGFESNLTGWTLNISSNTTPETYVDRTTGLAHTGSAYLYGGSKNSPAYIHQTFNVVQGEYINISFWWGYDGGLTIGQTCQAIGQLIPS